MNALLLGNKRATCRPISYKSEDGKASVFLPTEAKYMARMPLRGKLYCRFEDDGDRMWHIAVPYHKDDVMVARETWRVAEQVGENSVRIEFAADGHISNAIEFSPDRMAMMQKYVSKDRAKWNPAIYMPNEAARVKRRIKSCMPIQIQYLSAEDILDEGICKWEDDMCGTRYAPANRTGEAPILPVNGCPLTLAYAMGMVWDDTLSPSDATQIGYMYNPWVWHIEFGETVL